MIIKPKLAGMLAYLFEIDTLSLINININQ